MDIQDKVNRAWALKKEGRLFDALNVYNEIFDILCHEAGEYARSKKGSTVDEEDARKINPRFFALSKVYLKRDNVACVTLNNMGVILAEMGYYDKAKNKFKESIELIPDGIDYPNPKIGLESLE